MAFLTREDDDPAVLRGPMVDKILIQLIEEVEWGTSTISWSTSLEQVTPS